MFLILILLKVKLVCKCNGAIGASWRHYFLCRVHNFQECPPDVCTFLAASAQSEKDGPIPFGEEYFQAKAY